MNLSDDLFPFYWHVLAWLVLLPVLFVTWRCTDWRLLRNSRYLNVWLGAIVAIALFWQLRAVVRPGMELHFLGVTALTLMVGPWLAIIGMAAVMLGASANAWLGEGVAVGWAFALNLLVLGVLPVIATQNLLRWVERRLPANFFIYIFIVAFAGAGAIVLMSGVMLCLLLWLGDVYPLAQLLQEYLPFFLLQGFAEAWLTGAAITLMVLYRPLWVDSFNDRRYLFNK